MAELVLEPRAPDSQASAPQTTRLSRKKLNLWVNAFWKQCVVSPILRDNPLVFQGSDKFCNEKKKYFPFSTLCFLNLIDHKPIHAFAFSPWSTLWEVLGWGTPSAAFLCAWRPHASGSLKSSKHATFLTAFGHGKSCGTRGSPLEKRGEPGARQGSLDLHLHEHPLSSENLVRGSTCRRWRGPGRRAKERQSRCLFCCCPRAQV